MMIDYGNYDPNYDSDGFPHVKTESEIRMDEISKLENLRTAVRFGYKDADRSAYLHQLKRCMKYGQTFVNEAKRIRKWENVKKPKFI